MNAHASWRRGACPGLSAPMATGDGLLARLTPSGSTISLDAFAGLCTAAQRYGNGIIEITSRGSIQIRGLSADSAPLFAAEVASLGIEASDGIPVIVDPLASLGGDELCDGQALAGQIREGLAPLAGGLSPKVSVVVDSNGALHLDALAADVRLRALDRSHVHVSLGGDAAAARGLGAVPLRYAAECVSRLLQVLAEKEPAARMRDAVPGRLDVLEAAVADLLIERPDPRSRRAIQPIGMHLLGSGYAVGVGLPFGHCNSSALLALIECARRSGAAGVRAAPGRALLSVGLLSKQAFVAEVAALGFVVDPADPRRRVIACAGAPICASGEIPARSMAPSLVEAARRLPKGEFIHLSGCAKRCAHAGRAPLTVVGRDRRCDLLADETPVSSSAVEDLPAEMMRLVQSRGAQQ